MFELRQPRPKRRMSLTPMIDVVFLLLVFFMLASRFGIGREMPLAAGGAGGYSGPPRLVAVAPDGLTLNGRAVASDALPAALRALMSAPADVVVLRPVAGVDVQRLVAVAAALRTAGITHIALVD